MIEKQQSLSDPFIITCLRTHYGIEVAQVALAWVLRQKGVIAFLFLRKNL